MFGGKDVDRDGGLDCSGFVVHLFRAIGVDLGDPDFTNVRVVHNECTPVDDPEPGDLVFFTQTYRNDDGSWEEFSHIGIVKDPASHTMIDAHENRGAGETDYALPYWKQHFLDYGRPSI